jgi:exoribonuclease-2
MLGTGHCCPSAAQVLLSAPPPDPDASTRMDLTHLTVYTVDDASTTEVDDGLSITTDEAGTRLLWVHVADPTRWLTPGKHLAACRTACTWLNCHS